MKKHSFKKDDIVESELSHIMECLNQFDFLDVQWTCDCHCGLMIHHLNGEMNLWLKHEDNEDFSYILYCSIPEESFRGQSFQYKCLIEIYNYINLSNKLYPEEAINVEISIDPMKYYFSDNE